MPRPKSGKAQEVLTVRVPPGLVAELHDRARFRGLLFRDYVLNALEAYHDHTKFVPLDRDARQALGRVVQQLTNLTKTLREVQRPTSRTEPRGSVSRAPAESSADSVLPVVPHAPALMAARAQEPPCANGDAPPEADTPAHFLDDGRPFDVDPLPVPTPAPPAVAASPSDRNAGTQAVAAKRRGRKPALHKDEVMARMQRMHEAGMSGSSIAAALQAEGMPTLTGTETWQPRTVQKLVQQIRKETVC